MPLDQQMILKEINTAVSEWIEFMQGSKEDDGSDRSRSYAAQIHTRLASTIDRFAPKGSFHSKNLETILAKNTSVFFAIQQLAGSLNALKKEYELGHLHSVEELLNADNFSNFLEMAQHLLDQGYKDPAAVIAGSVLEQHLRELCLKHTISIRTEDGKYRRADALNTDLAVANVYNKTEQKSTTSWLGTRNDAAHGNYANYNAQQVKLLIDSITHFLIKYPA